MLLVPVTWVASSAGAPALFEYSKLFDLKLLAKPYVHPLYSLAWGTIVPSKASSRFTSISSSKESLLKEENYFFKKESSLYLYWEKGLWAAAANTV